MAKNDAVSENEFQSPGPMPVTYQYPRPALTVDCVIFGLDVEDSDLNEIQKDVKHRAARLYSFDEKAYRKLEKRGVHFEI